MNATIQKTIDILKKGGIVIFPTDTACALSCRIDNEASVERLFTIKQRDAQQAVPVFVDSIDMIKRYTENISPDILPVMQAYWPGALTIIIRIIEVKITTLIRGNGNTVGFRIPNDETVLEIIKGVGAPLIGTSANIHGRPTIYNSKNLDPELVSQVDFVLEGTCRLQQASTIINCSVDPWKIIRQGAVTIEL